MGLFKNITTGRDNATHDIARVIMVINAGILVLVFIAGVITYIYGWLISKPFDLQTLFNSSLTYVGGVSALLTSGAAAIYFKKSTEPDGSQTTVESIRKGEPENVTRVTTTNVIEPGSDVHL